MIRKTIESVLCAPARTELKQIQMGRFLTETNKIFRRVQHDPAIDVASIDNQIRAVAIRFGPYLNSPLKEVEDGTLEKLTKLIASYMGRFVDAGIITLSAKNIVIFTSVICDKFSTGWAIGNKCVVPRLDLFMRHAPPEISYGSLGLGISCRRMSSMSRTLQEAIVSQVDRTPKLKFCLALDG